MSPLLLASSEGFSSGFEQSVTVFDLFGASECLFRTRVLDWLLLIPVTTLLSSHHCLWVLRTAQTVYPVVSPVLEEPAAAVTGDHLVCRANVLSDDCIGL